MSHELILALAIFAFVSSITPGPNNMMLMASGANFGFRRTLPHMLGVAIGFAVMVALVGLGLAGLLEAVPGSAAALEMMSLIYLVYLAWRIATAAPPGPGQASAGRPLSFLQAALFQWVNPKAWAMSLTAIGVYAPDQGPAGVLIVALVFGAVNLPSVSAWAALGDRLRGFLRRPGRLRLFNVTMAVLLLGSIYPILA